METLNNTELLQIQGGGFASFLKNGFVGIIAACALVASVIYGYIHPTACEK